MRIVASAAVVQRDHINTSLGIHTMKAWTEIGEVLFDPPILPPLEES